MTPTAHSQPPPPKPSKADHPLLSSRATNPKARTEILPPSPDSKNKTATQRHNGFHGGIKKSPGCTTTKLMATMSLYTAVATSLVEGKIMPLKWSGKATWSRRQEGSGSRRRFSCRAVRDWITTIGCTNSTMGAADGAAFRVGGMYG